jgi:mannose-1-phosphate guanylyltransferase/mannose-6-phosphate isomerase
MLYIGMKDGLTPMHEDRPWGSFDRFTQNEPTTVKTIRVSPGQRLSLQRHHDRAEFWRVLDGTGTAEVAGVEYPLALGTDVFVPQGALHRLTAGDNGVEVLEIAFGHFDENDIERVEDDYGRNS